MKYELKSIKIFSAIKIGFFIWGLVGFLAGVYMAIMAPLLMTMMESMGSFPGGMADIGAVGFILFPIIYGIFGAVFGTVLTVIVAGFYNMLAALFGGLEFNFKEEQMKPLNMSFPDSPQQINSPVEQPKNHGADDEHATG